MGFGGPQQLTQVCPALAIKVRGIDCRGVGRGCCIILQVPPPAVRACRRCWGGWR